MHKYMGDLGSPRKINNQGSGLVLNVHLRSMGSDRAKGVGSHSKGSAPRVEVPGFMVSNNGCSKCFCFCFCHKAPPILELLLKLSSVVANSGAFAHHPPPIHSSSHYQSDGSACCHLSPAPSYPALFFLSSQHCLSAGFDLSSYTVSHTSLDRKNNLR